MRSTWTVVFLIYLMTGTMVEVRVGGFDTAEQCIKAEQHHSWFSHAGSRVHSVEHYCEIADTPEPHRIDK